MDTKKAAILAVVDAVCAEYGVTHQALRGRTMVAAVTEPRWVAVYLARKTTGAVFWEIGHLVARYTEVSASTASTKIRKRLPEDPALQERIVRIEATLYACLVGPTIDAIAK